MAWWWRRVVTRGFTRGRMTRRGRMVEICRSLKKILIELDRQEIKYYTLKDS